MLQVEHEHAHALEESAGRVEDQIWARERPDRSRSRTEDEVDDEEEREEGRWLLLVEVARLSRQPRHRQRARTFLNSTSTATSS